MINFKIEENHSKLFEDAMVLEMENPIKHFEKELVSIRTGRASTAMLDGIKAECYGQLMPLREVATLATPEANLITIQPWDANNIDAVEKAIRASDVGITPANDGTIIRLQLPQMSSTRREELVKTLGKKTEECKVAIRSVRKEFHNLVRETEKKHDISEDFAHRLNDSLQKITDKFIKKADEMNKKKTDNLKF